jgi:hypothetical protein
MGTGSRPNNKEKGILNLAMQPDDGGEAAENRALASLLADFSGMPGHHITGNHGGGIHVFTSDSGIAVVAGGDGRRAKRNLYKNCAALIT